MEANIEKLDDLIVCLVGMGFDLEDSQQAVQAGKLSVEAAVEWILSGKPGYDASNQGSKLKLAQKAPEPIGANPFTEVVAAPSQSSVGQSVREASSGEDDVKTSTAESKEEGVVSRCHMNEEQRRIKDRFQEKQREEARKSAQRDKLAEKRARAIAIQQIKEDRERQKIKTATVTQQSLAAATSPSNTPAASTGTKPADENKKQSSMIQVRLPNGKAIKQMFPCSSPLSDVWNWVAESYNQMQGFCLMQPFPRKEFSEADMLTTLSDHGLSPSGSLVLKKKENSANPEAGASPSDDTSNPIITSVSGPMAHNIWQPSSPGHNWGSGIPLTAGEGQGQEEEQQANIELEQEENMEVDEELGEDELGDVAMWQNAGPWQGPVGPPWQQGIELGQGWGHGQRLDGGWDQEVQLHQKLNPKQLAAEAARKRHTVHCEGQSSQEEVQCTTMFQKIPRLTDLLVENITSRICDSRYPVYNLYGIPAHHISLILNALIKSGKLNTKTMQPFLSSNLTKLVLDSYPYATNDLLSVIRLLRMLTHLSLASCPLITDKGLLLLKPLKRLKHINLLGCKQVTDKVFSLLKEMPNLTTLNLEGTNISNEGLINFCLTEPNADKLENLDLSRTQVTHNILPALQKIPNLKTLSLEQTKFISLAGIDKLTKLESLNLANTLIITDSLLCLSKHPTIRRLNISNTPQVDGDLALMYLQGLNLKIFQLPDHLSTSSQGLQYIRDMPLVELDLTNYINVDDAGMQYVAQIHTLKRLRLSNTRITDVGVVLIQGLPLLEELVLQRTEVTDKGASVICGKNFPNLHELSLSQTLISNDYLLSGSLNSCTHLSKLNLSDTAISNKGVKALALPYLELLNLSRTKIGPRFVLEIQTNARCAIPGCPRLCKISCNNTRGETDQEEDEDT